MSISNAVNHSHTSSRAIALLGYCDQLSNRPGDTVNFKVSSLLDQPFNTSLVRVICADPNPNGPGIIEQAVDADFTGQYPSREQAFFPGSYARTDHPIELNYAQGFTLTANVWPTLHLDRRQTILNHENCELGIDENGAVYGQIFGNQVATCLPITLRRWYRIALVWDASDHSMTVSYQSIDTAPKTQDNAQHICTNVDPNQCHEAPFLIAAKLNKQIAQQHFNGKIEHPCIATSNNRTTIAHWDFAEDMSGLAIRDSGNNHWHGHLVNLPARAMTGSNWDGSEMCWRHAPNQYAAIHFHDDDIIDFHWQTDFSYTIPVDLPSGIYAAKIEAAGHNDSMVFFVCPPAGETRAKLAVLISTFTYSVYGNHARPDFTPQWKERFESWHAYPWNPAEYPEYGLSTYNFHHDGSGVCHASHRRPLFNLKSGYLTFGYGPGSGLRHLQADTHLIAWLHHKGIDYDVVTDDELHKRGVDAITNYATVCTGSHPEYHTPESLNALQGYRDTGGHFMYLGGNGFYWRVALHREQPGAIEIRRAEGGIRAWAAEPGEYYQAFDGQYGGLWRRNGRPPQQLAGIGFSAQGQFEGTWYKRSAASYDDQYQWIFDGVTEDIIGDFGLSGGGAAGFELDRADTRLGTPESVVVLASSETAPGSFVLVPEEQLTHITTWSGEPIKDLLHADMVYFEVPGGGRVFATGSITFCGSLPHNNFDNNISRIVENVVREFCDDTSN